MFIKITLMVYGNSNLKHHLTSFGPKFFVQLKKKIYLLNKNDFNRKYKENNLKRPNVA